MQFSCLHNICKKGHYAEVLNPEKKIVSPSIFRYPFEGVFTNRQKDKSKNPALFKVQGFYSR